MAAGLSTRLGAWVRSRRGAAALAVLAVVLLLHGEALRWLDQSMVGWGAASKPPRRLQVAFVHPLRPAPPRAAPPVKAPARPPATRRVEEAPRQYAARGAEHPPAPQQPASAASAPEPAPSAPVIAAVADPASAPALVASAPIAAAPAASAAASQPPAFDWPPSTHLHYALSGNYRGKMEGSAVVEWLRVGSHYQVQMDVTIGIPIAPLMTRHVQSDGEITDRGLQPQRFDEQTKVAFKSPWHVNLQFTPGIVMGQGGFATFAPPGTQDSASQFVQLTWLFTMHPDWLRTGNVVGFPMALARRVDPWTYDVLESDTLYTRFGGVPVFHVKPRPLPNPRGVLGIEMWFAPSLQYLPARILIRENADTWIDMVLDELPLQAAQ
jgi:hypothetical protein